jgi:hypothetical protein
MNTLKHLMAIGVRTGPGPYMDSWPRMVMFIFLIAVVAGAVAIWNRSRYHP